MIFKRIWPKVLLGLIGMVLLLILWMILSVKFSGLIVASPFDTFKAGAALLSDGNFLIHHFLVSLKRLIISLFLGISIGSLLGIAAGLFKPLRYILEPLRWMLMTIPGVVVVVVFMLWFGMGDLMIISLTSAMTAPVVFVNISHGVAEVDKNLIEMASVYRFSFLTKLKKIYGKSMAGPFFSGVVIAAGNGIRVVVLGEVLGGNSGIGYYLSISRTELDTAKLYALALISMSIVGGLEFFILSPLKKRFVWKR